MLTKLQIASFYQNGFLSLDHPITDSLLARIQAELTDLWDRPFLLAVHAALPETQNYGRPWAGAPTRNRRGPIIDNNSRGNLMLRSVPKD